MAESGVWSPRPGGRLRGRCRRSRAVSRCRGWFRSVSVPQWARQSEPVVAEVGDAGVGVIGVVAEARGSAPGSVRTQ